MAARNTAGGPLRINFSASCKATKNAKARIAKTAVAVKRSKAAHNVYETRGFSHGN
jgi:pantothenate kinase